MEFDTHARRFQALARDINGWEARGSDLSERRVDFRGMFTRESLGHDVEALKLLGRGVYELAIFTPHLPEVISLTRESKRQKINHGR